MRTDFSEFSFGYALTEEFMQGLPNIVAAPIFPSLIEEGMAGGGYDVKFDDAGVPVLIQFKRPDVMLTARSKELSSDNLALNLPFYRMHIRSSAYSQQHNLLLAQDDGTKRVYYASPCFHDINDFNAYYVARTVIDNTLFIRPTDIGALTAEAHHLSYDSTAMAWRYSEPLRIPEVRKGRSIADDIFARIKSDPRRLDHGPLSEALERTKQSLLEAGFEISERPMWTALKESEPKRQLRELSDLAITYLNSQLFIFQQEPQS